MHVTRNGLCLACKSVLMLYRIAGNFDGGGEILTDTDISNV